MPRDAAIVDVDLAERVPRQPLRADRQRLEFVAEGQSGETEIVHGLRRPGREARAGSTRTASSGLRAGAAGRFIDSGQDRRRLLHHLVRTL